MKRNRGKMRKETKKGKEKEEKQKAKNLNFFQIVIEVISKQAFG